MRTYRHDSRSPHRGLRFLVALALVLGTGTAVQAQERRYLVELGAAGVYQSFDEQVQLSSSLGVAGRVGIWLPRNFSAEAEAAVAPTNTDPGDVGVSVKTLSASLLYNILIGKDSWAHLRVGMGRANYGDSVGAIVSRTAYPFLAGAGLRIGVAPDVMVRTDFVWSLYRARQNRETVYLNNTALNLGVSYMVGSKPIADSDGDGILENRDRCPDTPSGAQVDGSGCPSDSDADGVPDGVDRCANTAPGAEVNATGCTQDSDGDNIADGLDRCPDTESGVLVDPNGCPKDSDGDQIPDGLDRCSETLKGATVDALGCPGDEDGDGVLDGLDRCPRTPTGAAITPEGCPTAPAPAQRAAPQRTPRPTPPAAAPPAAPQPQARAPARTRGGITPGVIAGVGFAPGSARLRSDSYVPLDSIADIMKADTAMRAEIGAHTDNAGTAAESQHLTNLQAEAVRTYLVTRGVRYQQLQARGYGATVPLTPDNSPRGRAANRRIEIKPAQ